MEESAIWTEKYRPKEFNEVKGQDEIVKRVKSFVESKNMPHQMYSGPAGTGKSTLALVAARNLFKENWHQNFLELNASDERGIDIIRHKVKDFARTRSIGEVPFKIIFLDESDALTREAQQALRRTMENYTSTCRFILSCVTPDTKILLSNEREILIKDFIDQYEHNTQNIHVQNLSQDKKTSKKDLVLASVKLPASSIGKKVLEITTTTGRKIKVTNDHLLLTVKGWKRADKLTKEDKLLIQPHLEGTPVEDNDQKIIDLQEFISFLSSSEEQEGLKNIENASRFRELKSQEKEKILVRIAELRRIINQNKGLTEREFETYTLIKKNHGITRSELQAKLNITRMGVNYLLPTLEKKGYIKRIINKKIHSFIITGLEPIVLRNDMHIKRTIENEFDMDISYTAVRKSRDSTLDRGKVDRILGELKRKNILDTSYNDIEKAGALARLCGFMLGDGHLVRNSIRLHFSGNKAALKEVQKDLDILRYENYSKIKSVTLTNTILGRKFAGTTTSFTLDSRPMSLLLQYFGIPTGDKTITLYNVPSFIKEGTKFVKREFIRALFGCDADKPKYKKMNFGALSLRQNKTKFLKKNMLTYYEEISKLLLDFEITSYVTIRDKGEVRKRDKFAVLTIDLTITPNNFNLHKYFSRIGYAYENYKIKLARLCSEYLRHKLFLIETWKQKGQMAVTLVKEGSGIRKAAREIGTTPDFISNQLKGKEARLPWKHFMSVDNWIKKYAYNDLLITSEIIEIKSSNEDIVMDITCNEDHNFISNGFVSHNCNYSSKIIDPIQSRCAVFRFKPLKEKDILSLLDKIAKEEKIKIDEKSKKALAELSEGDCRKLVNLLQSAASVSSTITEKAIYDIASIAAPKEIKEILDLAIQNKFEESRKKLLDTMLNYGLSGIDIVKQIQKEILNLEIGNREKMRLIEKCGEIEFRLVEGSDAYIQLEALLSQFTLAK